MLGHFRRWFSQSRPQSPRSLRSAGSKSVRRLSLERLEQRTLLSGPDITVLDNLTPIANGSTNAINFGTVARGDVGPTHGFTLRNDGDSMLVLTSLNLPVGFSIVDAPTSRLAPRGAQIFTVRLDSTVVGTQTGSIQIASNDADESTFTFAISGTVTPNGPEVAILLGNTLIEDGTPAAVPWPGVVVGDTGPIQTFTIQNNGTQTLAISNINFPAGFNLVGTLPSAVAPQSTDVFKLRLQSSTVGLKSGQVHLFSNDADTASYDFPITGLVTATPVPSLTLLDGYTVLTSGTSTVYFGKVIKDQTGPSRTFTIRNDGTDTLTLDDIDVPDGFTLVDGVGESLEPASSDSFTVQLNTAVIAELAGDITVESNDPLQSHFQFGISGDVVANAPEIRVFHNTDEFASAMPTPFAFDPVVQGKSAPNVIFTVANFGVKVLTLGTVTVPAGFKLVAGLPASLPPDTFSVIIVQLDSKVLGTSTGNITVPNNDSDENPFLLPITGTVQPPAPEIAVSLKGKKLVDRSNAPLAFGDGYLGQAGPLQTFTVRNEGAGQLTLGAVTLPTGFTLVQGLPAALAGHKSASFIVRLDTAALGEYSGEITIASNDSDENPFHLAIRANVLIPPAPDIVVLNGVTILVSGDTTPIDLGTAPFRKKGTSLVLSIRNDGDGTLNLSSVDLPAGFVLAKKPPKRIAPNRTATFQLRLDSRLAGFHSGQVVLHSDDSTDPAFSLSVQGTVLA